MSTGLSAIYDQGFMKYSLGFGTTNLPATPGAGLSMALFTLPIGTTKTGFTNEWAVGTVTSYTTRLAFGNDTANWIVNAFVAGTGIVAGNAVQKSFPALTGTGVNLEACALCDSNTTGAGNMIWFADVTTQAIAVGIIVAYFTNASAALADVVLTLL